MQLIMKKTLVLGASTNPSRTSHTAIHRLNRAGHEVIAQGIREGAVDGIEIQQGKPELEGIDTITLYLNPKRQEEYYDYILGLNPKRIIFNPGTENPKLVQLARTQGIETETACTLIMLSVGNY